MDRKLIATIIAVVVVILALAGIIWAVNMNNDNQQNNQDGTDTTETSNVNPAEEFKPIDPSSLSYESTSSTAAGEMTITTTTRNDGNGTSVTSTVADGETTDTYVTGDKIITCINDVCRESSVSQEEVDAQPTVDPAQFQGEAKHTGSEACGSETCEVWTVSTDAGDFTYHVNDQNRIVKTVVAGVETTYEYKDVTINIPEVQS